MKRDNESIFVGSNTVGERLLALELSQTIVSDNLWPVQSLGDLQMMRRVHHAQRGPWQ